MTISMGIVTGLVSPSSAAVVAGLHEPLRPVLLQPLPGRVVGAQRILHARAEGRLEHLPTRRSVDDDRVRRRSQKISVVRRVAAHFDELIEKDCLQKAIGNRGDDDNRDPRPRQGHDLHRFVENRGDGKARVRQNRFETSALVQTIMRAPR